MKSKELMDLLAKAFSFGEIDALIPHMADNCDYFSEYSGKKFFCAQDIIHSMRKVFSNLDDTNSYTYKLVSLDDVLKGITVAELDNMEGMHPCPWAILLYQFDAVAPASLVSTMIDLEGKLRSIHLSRDAEKFDLAFDDYAEEDDSPMDLPNTVTPLTTNDRHRKEMQQAFSGQPRKYESEEHPKYYIWRKADDYAKAWLKDLGYTVLESEIFEDCIGYRCNRKGYAYTVFMYAYGKKQTSQLDGDFCSKLATLPLAAKSTILILYLNVKKSRKGKEYDYRVCNYYGGDSSPELWHLEQVNGKYILEYYPRKEMMDTTFQLMYAFNRDCADVYECIITQKNPAFCGLEHPGATMNAAFFTSAHYLHEKHGNMKLGYVRYNDVIYSAVPYLEGYGFFGFRCDNHTDRILEVTAYPFAGGEREVAEFIKTEIQEPDDLFDYIPQLVEAVPLAPVDTERFAVKLYWDNGECRKYVLPIDEEHEKDEEVSFQRYTFTDEVWSSIQITHSRPVLHRYLNCGPAIAFKNEMYISAMQCYLESTPYSEPQLADEIIYQDEKHCLRKVWTWAAKAIYEDEETGLLKTLLSGHAFNWHGLSTYATIDGKRCTSLDFDYIDNFREGLAGVGIQGRRRGYVDQSMQLVIPPIYDDVRRFYNGRALVKRNGTRLVVNYNGEEMPLLKDRSVGPYQDASEFFSDGLCRVSTLKLRFMDLAYHSDYAEIAGCWGFINEAGKEVIPPQYIYANDFEDGLAIVCKGEWTIDPKWDNECNKGRYWTETELWGGIDCSGNEVIPFIFDEIKHFNDTTEVLMAHVGGWHDGKWGVIDRRGNWIADPIFEDFGYDYMDGLITFYAESKWSGDDTPLGIYDLKAKKVLFEPQFLDVDLNEDGTIEVEVFDEKLGRTITKIIDRDGHELFPSEYSSIYTWKEPFEVVIRDENGDRHGLIDKSGKVLLPCKYPAAWSGLYWEEKRIIFEEGSKKGLMDLNDTIIIPSIYSEIYGVDAPLLIVKACNEDTVGEGLLDHDGKTILPVEYDSIKWLKDKTHLVCCKDGLCGLYRYTSECS